MKQIKLALTTLFAFATIVSVNAQDEDNPIALGFSANVVDFYGSSDFSDQFKDLLGNGDWNIFVPRITAEKYLKNGFSVQIGASVNQINTVAAKDDVDYLYWSFDPIAKYDLNYLIGKTGWFDPYAYAGVSYVNSDSNSAVMPNIGGGFNVWFNDNLGLNFHTGTKVTLGGDVSTHYQTSLGLVLKFGGKDTDGDGVYDDEDACPEIAGLVEFNGCPDTDGDGIKDSDDACPEVAGSTLLNGCPDNDGDGVADKDDMCPNAKGTKANKGCPDSDGDGVVDKDDKCPTENGPVSNNGCPLADSDNDGIVDKDDKCPNTAGVSSNDGCPEGMISPEDAFKILEKSRMVLFSIGRSEIKSRHTEHLDVIVEIMNNNPQATFTLEGNTDTTGPDKLNKRLSVDRAEVIKNYLVKKGVSADRLSTIGNSDTKPVATNETREGRSKNRRTDIRSTN